MHSYDDPNTCYAIGDSFAVMLGTATTNRQPSAGVFEELSSLSKQYTTDAVSLYDGTNISQLMAGDVRSGATHGATPATRDVTYNMAIKIGNTVYFRKEGTANRVAISGVQVDA